MKFVNLYSKLPSSIGTQTYISCIVFFSSFYICISYDMYRNMHIYVPMKFINLYSKLTLLSAHIHISDVEHGIVLQAHNYKNKKKGYELSKQ